LKSHDLLIIDRELRGVPGAVIRAREEGGGRGTVLPIGRNFGRITQNSKLKKICPKLCFITTGNELFKEVFFIFIVFSGFFSFCVCSLRKVQIKIYDKCSAYIF
jgi:hypothetical protein